MNARDPNRAMLVATATALKHLRERVVFVGGASLGLLIDDPAAPSIRTTFDVVGHIGYQVHLREELGKLGFKEDARDGAPLCRWVRGELTLDVMPADDSAIGPTNRWYKEALASAEAFTLSNGVVIRVISAPCFLATKLEAYAGRGEDDLVASHDVEDFVAVLDGRPSVVDEIDSASDELRAYLRVAAQRLITDSTFVDLALPGHLYTSPPGRVEVVLGRLKRIAGES